MKKQVLRSLCAFSLVTICSLFIHAQTTGSIAGTVLDSNRATIPGANISVIDQNGREFTAASLDSGIFRIPALSNGIYTVRISATGFKTAVIENVKVDVDTPASVNAVLEAGSIEETVTIESGAEVLQTQTAAVGATITGRQIVETPIASRNAMDLILLAPGTASVGRPRNTSINGLPKAAISITLDGVEVQDNYNRSSDGFLTRIVPRLDSIEEVNVSTSNPGAESGGDGAIQIRFVTKRGTNDYRGSLFYQHRNEALNSNYWFVNRDRNLGVDEDGKALRQKIRLHQYGGSIGGPLPFPRFGDSGGPHFSSGKDRAFFFVSYEGFRLPESIARTRTVLTPAAQAGIFSYISGGVTRTVDLYALAAVNNQVATPDPTIATLLTRIRAATATAGNIRPIVNSAGVVSDPNRLFYDFAPASELNQEFLTLRFDFNVTKRHSLESIMNRQKSLSTQDYTNNVESRYPGFPGYSQDSKQNSFSIAVRSNLSANLVNDARYSHSFGRLLNSKGISVADFAVQGGYYMTVGMVTSAAITPAIPSTGSGDRSSPVADFTDSLTWIRGTHTFNFGWQYKRIRLQRFPLTIVPTINFGIVSTGAQPDPADAMFSQANFPGASVAQLNEARGLYATLIGRISGYVNDAILTEEGVYRENVPMHERSRQDIFGLWAQDSWKIRPNLTLNYGLRWQPHQGFVVLSRNLTRLASFDDLYGISGPGNIFRPGVMTGREPTAVAIESGEPAFRSDHNNFAPSVGLVWSPGTASNGFFGRVLGGPGKSVFRVGFSLAFIREGTALVGNIFQFNPGARLNVSRTAANGLLIVGTNLRDPNNPNLRAAPYPSSPTYPLPFTPGSIANAFDPNLRTGSVASFSLGYQREIDRNTVIEVRYMGNRGRKLWRQHNINEINTIENGFADEFRLAQQNLYANLAAGRGLTFAYFGAGTNQLPIILSFTNSAGNYDPANPARYGAFFSNAAFVARLAASNPNAIEFATGLENNITRRANALANMRPANFFYVNPATGVSGAYVVDNSAASWYDAGVIELRRRLSGGFRIAASYVFSKAQTDSFQSNANLLVDIVHRDFGRRLAKNVAVFDIRHMFKFDATFDLPFGRGSRFFSTSDRYTDALIGGWSILPVIRWQSGSPISFGNVQLVGMTAKDLQREIKVRKGANAVTYLPDDIILNTQRAFNIDVSGPGGYGTTFGGPPQGRFIAPAGYGNCISRYAGECGFANLVLHGPNFLKLDATLAKRIRFDEKRGLELRATILDVLNRPSFRIGGWNGDVVTATLGGPTFGQLISPWAYQDTGGTNDPGGRLIDLMLRFHF